jgi:transposase
VFAFWDLDVSYGLVDVGRWLRIVHLLPGKPTDKDGRVVGKRCLVEVVLLIAWTGCPRRDLPRGFGKWCSLHDRFACWEVGGVWRRVVEAFQGEADWEERFMEAAMVRAHPHSAGAPEKTVAIKRSAVREAGRAPKSPPASMPWASLCA